MSAIDGGGVKLNDQEKARIRRMYCTDKHGNAASDDEFAAFIHLVIARGLDPRLGHCRMLPKRNKVGENRWETRWIPYVQIDGFRLLADRTGKYMPGNTRYEYNDKGELIVAYTGVKKLGPDGSWHEIAEPAHWAEYGSAEATWGKLPHVMLAKVSEARGLRRAFPDTFAGVYAKEELDADERPTFDAGRVPRAEPGQNTGGAAAAGQDAAATGTGAQPPVAALPPLHANTIKQRAVIMETTRARDGRLWLQWDGARGCAPNEEMAARLENSRGRTLDMVLVRRALSGGGEYFDIIAADIVDVPPSGTEYVVEGIEEAHPTGTLILLFNPPANSHIKGWTENFATIKLASDILGNPNPPRVLAETKRRQVGTEWYNVIESMEIAPELPDDTDPFSQP